MIRILVNGELISCLVLLFISVGDGNNDDVTDDDDNNNKQ